MRHEFVDESPLFTPSLTASDLRSLAGLSYRQLNDWEERGSLPSSRASSGGWRRFTAWQAMSLRILGELRRCFGVPLVKQRELLAWMIGTNPTPRDLLGMDAAEGLLLDTYSPEDEGTPDELPLDEDEARRTCDYRLGFLRTRRVEMRELAAANSVAERERLAESLAELGATTLRPLLVQRGWAKGAGKEFARRFFLLSVEARTGQYWNRDVAAETVALMKLALEASDRIAEFAIGVTMNSLLPLHRASRVMKSGYPVLLVTDLLSSAFASEVDLEHDVQYSRLPNAAIILQVSDHINAVLEAVGWPTRPVTQKLFDHRADFNRCIEADIAELLGMLRFEGFDRLTIEANGGRTVWERSLDVKDLREIERRFAEHDYQSITLTRREGRISHVVQSISRKGRTRAEDGRTPPPLREEDD